MSLQARREPLQSSCSICHRPAAYLVFGPDQTVRGKFCEEHSLTEVDRLNRSACADPAASALRDFLDELQREIGAEARSEHFPGLHRAITLAQRRLGMFEQSAL